MHANTQDLMAEGILLSPSMFKHQRKFVLFEALDFILEERRAGTKHTCDESDYIYIKLNLSSKFFFIESKSSSWNSNGGASALVNRIPKLVARPSS